MRRRLAWALLGTILAPILSGCLGPSYGSTEGTDPATPDLPDTVRFEAGELLEATRDARTYRWEGIVTGPAQTVDGESVAPGEPTAKAPLLVPGTLPLEISLSLGSPTGALLRLALVDEYGFHRCQAIGAADDERLACVDRETAPLGWDHSWSVEVSLVGTRETEVPFDVALTVRTLPGAAVEAVAPAGLAEIAPLEATADDGTPMRGHVYVPNGAGPFGTVLQFSPYWNGKPADQSESQAMEVGGRRTIAWTSAGHLGVLLDAGFAVAIVNMRGTGESGGCNTWFDIDRDGRDAHAVIQTIAEQPWSNGNVGMMGISWHGYSQYAAALADPPALKALAPASAVLDPWLLWTRYGAPLELGPTTGLPLYGLTVLDNGGWLPAFGDRSPDHLTCPAYGEQALEVSRITETGDETLFWAQRRAHDALAGSDTPMLVTNGLLIPHEGHILQAEGLWPLLPEGSHLMLGVWGHEYPEGGGAHHYLRMLVDWFDEHLRGGPPRVAPGVTYQDAAGAWHSAPQWPPSAVTAQLHLTGTSLVADSATVEASEQRLQSMDDEDPKPTQCPFWAVYATPPLAENVSLAGNFEAEITVSSTEPDGNFAVFLWHAADVVPCMEDPDATLVGRALTDLRHRGHLRTGEPFPVGQEAVVQLRSHPLATEIPAGHRLVLAVGGDSSSELRDKALLPVITVRTGDGKAGELRLPVVQGRLAFT